MVDHQTAKFGGHSHFGSWDIIFLVCQAISQGYVMKASSEEEERRRGGRKEEEKEEVEMQLQSFLRYTQMQ